MTINVTEPGLLTTIQDLGRVGFQEYGVVVGGVMDEAAATLANLVVGNPEGKAVLEITVIGPSLSFEDDYLISICGADLSAKIDDVSVPLWRPVYVKKGSRLTFGRPKSGCRSYVAVAGGFDVPVVMNSRSTYVRGKIGGMDGRALEKGDLLRSNDKLSIQANTFIHYLKRQTKPTPFQTVNWTIGPDIRPVYRKNPRIRFLKGPQFHEFNHDSRRKFLTKEYKITPQSDRMGYRLAGPKLDLSSPLNLLSEAVTMGTIQVPRDGQPIILMSDCQTIGGYPKIGYVISVDLPHLAQVMPGEKIKFEEISLSESQYLLLERDRLFKKMRVGFSLAIRRMKNDTS